MKSAKMWIQEVTPEWALAALEKAKSSVINRSVQETHVEFLANEMREGRWRLNGVPVIFDDDGMLMDGQHRLWAVVKSGKKVQMACFQGTDRVEAMPTIDTGTRPRTFGNVIEINRPLHRDVPKPAQVSAATKTLAQYLDRGFFSPRKRYSAGFLEGLLKKHSGLVDSVQIVQPLTGFYPSLSMAAFCHYVFSGRNSVKADAFITALASGLDMKKGDPVHALRDRIIQHHAKKERRTIDHITYVTFRAWLFFEAEAPCTVIPWRRQATEHRPADTFPYLDDYPTERSALLRKLEQKGRKK